MPKCKENISPNIRGKGKPISPQIKESVLYLNHKLESIGTKKKEIIKTIRDVTKIGRSSIFRILR